MLLTLVGIAIAFVVTLFWPTIRSALSKSVIPYVRKLFGDKFADPLVSIVSWLDGKIRGVRRGFKESLKFIKEKVLGIRTTYERKPGSDVVVGTQVVDIDGDEEVIRIKKPSSVPFDELPPAWQNKLLEGEKSVTVDEKQLMLEKAKERLKASAGADASEDANEVHDLNELVNEA